MASQLSNNLFYSILALDAYNRGYDAKLPGLSDATGTQLGDAKIIATAGDKAAQDIGFYALAYDWNGKTIISYRGTDNPNILQKGNDIWNGWVGGAGIISTQSEAALKFYADIVGQSPFVKNNAVVTTGHSLGGGLAGYVAAISNGAAYAYDPMPFGAATITKVIDENIKNNLSSTKMLSFLTGIGNSPHTLMPDADFVKTISVSGEALEPVRFAAKTLGSAVEAGVATALLAAKGYPLISVPAGVGAGVLAASVSSEGTSEKLAPVAKGLGMVDLHSQALLAILQYAQDKGHKDWQGIADQLLPLWFKTEIAQPYGLTNDQMLRQIVYSALDSGSRPFGSTGIAALFNDADEYGRVVKMAGVNERLADAATQKAISAIITSFAGDLAYNKVDAAQATEGVLTYNDTSKAFVIDLRASTWDKGLAVADKVPFKKELVSSLTKGFLADNQMSEIDLIVSTAQKVATPIELAFDLNASESALFLGDGYKDAVFGTSGNDYFYTYDDGSESIDGKAGFNTVIYSGAQNDYKIVREDGKFYVTALKNGLNTTDILTQIDMIRFVDQKIVSDDVLTTSVDVVYDVSSSLSDEIVGLYETAFDRLPDTEGFLAWSAMAQATGDTYEVLVKVADQFLSSNEFSVRNAAMDNAAFVDCLYDNAFTRDPTQSDKDVWVAALDKGMTRAEVLAQFATSSEMVATVGTRANIDVGYWTV